MAMCICHYTLYSINIFVVSGHLQRMYPPSAWFTWFFTKTEPEIILEQEMFDFSGIGALIFYKRCCTRKWMMRLNGGNDGLAAQILFHSIWGTYKSDLGVLSQITDRKEWVNRASMKDVFKGQNKGECVHFQPIKFKYYSKLTSASQTGLLADNTVQLFSVPVFSGYNTVIYSDAFWKVISNHKNVESAGLDVNKLIEVYARLAAKLASDIKEQGNKASWGTKGWLPAEEVTAVHLPPEVEVTITGTGKFFHGDVSGN